jgi:hypothetical protein
MVDLFKTLALVMQSDVIIRNRMIAETKARVVKEKAMAKSDRVQMQPFTQEVRKLPKNLQSKLATMTAEEIEKFLKTYGDMS